MKKLTFDEEKDSSKILNVAIGIIEDRVKNYKLDRMNIANLAKKCKVSRAWIYKNFGSSSEQIILTAIDILAPTLTASIRPMDVWRTKSQQEWLIEMIKSLELTLEQVESHPAIFQFYIFNRLQSSKIGQHLARQESRFISHIVRRQIELSDNKLDLKMTTVAAEHLAAVRIGLIFRWLSQPHLSREEKSKELKTIALIFSKNK